MSKKNTISDVLNDACTKTGNEGGGIPLPYIVLLWLVDPRSKRAVRTRRNDCRMERALGVYRGMAWK